MAEFADIFVIGGGINGAGIARDAAGRGLKVILAEKDDLASHTSSASSKLIHGGLRYLEHYEFRLVRESLQEREVLLKSAPHLIHPMRFVLPHHKGLRPAFILRLGLFLYDHIGGRKLLPGTKTRNLRAHPTGEPLKPSFTKGFEYSDCWVDDARLVTLAAKDAAERGATILTRTKVTRATRKDGIWEIKTTSGSYKALALVNAAGPWVDDLESKTSPPPESTKTIRMVKGSHIIVPKLYEGEKSYTFQGADGRVVFAIPYQGAYTLIGTTDVPFEGDANHVSIEKAESKYLMELVENYFQKSVSESDIIWSYSGVRPLVNDGSASVSKATRDYVLELDTKEDAPMVSVYGGKITTFRCLAEDVLEKLEPLLAFRGKPWTKKASLPGGEIPYRRLEHFRKGVEGRYPWLEKSILTRMMNAYGTRIHKILKGANAPEDLGQHFGAGLYEAEVNYMIREEWAKTEEDILWRRSKLGLHMSQDEQAALTRWLAARKG